MIVYIPYREDFFSEVYDSESPWKTRSILSPIIEAWLDDRCKAEWDWTNDLDFLGLEFEFSEIDVSIAVLFKLTFGGS